MLNAKILLVSDDLETSQLWAYGLGQKDLDVTVVSPSQVASGPWMTETLALVIIDVNTAQLDGLELCHRLRSEVTHPILLLKHNRDEPSILKAYQAGVDEYIVKPISFHMLLAKVTAWLRRSGPVRTGSWIVWPVGDLLIKLWL